MNNEDKANMSLLIAIGAIQSVFIVILIFIVAFSDFGGAATVTPPASNETRQTPNQVKQDLQSKIVDACIAAGGRPTYERKGFNDDEAYGCE